MINKELRKISKETTLLYVEDEKMIREQYASVFGLLFKEVTTAANGVEALEAYKKKNYDLIITDLTMPQMDGAILISKVFEINPNQHIITMTAHNSSEDLRSSIEFQVDGILLKPVHKDKLFTLLDKVCHHINSEKKESIDTLFPEKEQDLFVVVVDKMDEIVKEFGTKVKSFILDTVKEHLANFGIENENTLKISNDAIFFTAQHSYLDNILETFQDFSQKYNAIEIAFHDLKIYITLSYGVIMKKEIQNSENDYNYMDYINSIIDEIRKNEYSTDIVTMDINLEEAKKSNALKWLDTIHKALEQKTIIPFYQPAIDIKTLQIISYEVFSRIKQDDKYILPKFFIDLSEKAGILEAMARVVFEQVFEKFSTTQYSLCLNLGNLELRDHAFVEYLVYLANRFEINYDRVILNIRHYESIDLNGRRVKTILKLKELGFKIALKWFTNSNLNMEFMATVQPDYIKINQIVVQKSFSDEHMKLMLSFLLQYATKANIQTVLFNVDDKNVLDEAKSLGFDAVQGYLIAHPSDTLVQTQLKAL